MASFDEELLSAARRLIQKKTGQKGKLSDARIRRSISTSYYAVFHFLLEEVGLKVVGTRHDLRRRRRILARTLTHTGVKLALERVRGSTVDGVVADFLRDPSAAPASPVLSPPFARLMASVFVDAQAKRHDADYDLNVRLSENDAKVLRQRIKRAIAQWRRAKGTQDKDFKNALCALMLMKGKLRPDN